MNEKMTFNIQTDNKKISIAEGIDNYSAGVIVPIVSEGDTIGSVVFVMKDGEKPGEVESKLAESAAGFLGRHMEN